MCLVTVEGDGGGSDSSCGVGVSVSVGVGVADAVVETRSSKVGGGASNGSFSLTSSCCLNEHWREGNWLGLSA